VPVRCECGVFAIYGHPGAARFTHLGLYALQHRGQESAGIVAADGRRVAQHKGMGLVSEVFREEVLDGLSGHLAVGHVRYSTTGSSHLINAQPLVVRYRHGQLALAHNGNLVNAAVLRENLEEAGSIFQTSVDTEVVAHLIARAGRNGLEGAVREALAAIAGGYAMLMMTEDRIIAARDPNGIRPLSLGRLGDVHVLASETCAFDTIGAEFVRDVRPGEMIILGPDGLRSEQVRPAGRRALCAFEFIYLARPDSNIEGLNVHSVRKQLGRRLAQDYPADADLVIGVPDSSISAATGFAEESGIPYEMGLVKNRYIGRTFIQPSQQTRDFSVRVKLNPLRKLLSNRRVVLVDDSIVRGTTCRHLVRLLRDAGASEVHLRIASPPYRCPCFFGIDTSSGRDLIAVGYGCDVDAIRRAVGADTLAYMSVEGLTTSIGFGPDSLCLACFNEEYPVDIGCAQTKFALEEGD
jgi:amidophosphoribosyltransferase